MMNLEAYRQHAADCLRQAEAETAPEDRNILLNVALAWVRLAHQVQEVGAVGAVEAAGAAGAVEVAEAAPGVVPETEEAVAEAVEAADTEQEQTGATDEPPAKASDTDRKPPTRLDQFQNDVEKALFTH